MKQVGKLKHLPLIPHLILDTNAGFDSAESAPAIMESSGSIGEHNQLLSQPN